MINTLPTFDDIQAMSREQLTRLLNRYRLSQLLTADEKRVLEMVTYRFKTNAALMSQSTTTLDHAQRKLVEAIHALQEDPGNSHLEKDVIHWREEVRRLNGLANDAMSRLADERQAYFSKL